MENNNMEGFNPNGTHEAEVIEMPNAQKYDELVDSINMLDVQIAAEQNEAVREELIAKKTQLEQKLGDMELSSSMAA